MNRTETVASVAGIGERQLHEHDLDAVSGGIQDEENFIERGVNLLIPANYFREDRFR